MTVSKKFLLWFFAAVLILGMNTFISRNALQKQFHAADAVETSLRVLDAVKDIQFNTVNMEIAQRNYIVSSNGKQLHRAQEALAETRNAAAKVYGLWAGHPGNDANLGELDALLSEQQEKFARLIEVQDSVGFAAAIKLLSGNGGGAALDRIYQLIGAMSAAENELLVQRTEQSRQYTRMSRVTFYVAAIFNLVLLSIVCLLAYREIRERRQAERILRFTATHDPLTALPNRTLFSERLNRRLSRRQNDRLAVLFIDLDRFKNINDTLGHESGDRLLQEVARRLSGCIRRQDTVARQGGDEFVVLIEDFSDARDIAIVTEKILAEVAKPLLLDAKEFNITASIGVSTFPNDGSDMQTLLKNADIAMYRAKEQGKNNYQFYAGQMNVHSVERLALEADLRRALERNEMLLHYQPKMDAQTGRITSMEALLRWRHPRLGLIPPGQCIPLAEETGLIVSIGEWVLRTACAQNRAWQKLGLPRLRVAVNLSPRQFSNSLLVAQISNILAETGLEPRWLDLEITESMVMHDPEQAVKTMKELKGMGIGLSIDDFGTGYSSLSYLKRFPIDSLKLDGSFIRDIPGNDDDTAITRAVIAMAHGLKLKVVAEGVENELQAQFLRGEGCNEMQGYYFSHPLPEAEFAALLEGQRPPQRNKLFVLKASKQSA